MIKKSLIAILACLMMISCSKYEYTDQLQKLGGRVENLEAMVLEANTQIENLRKIITVIENNGYITDMMISSDGEYYLTFNNGETIVLRQGKKGKDGEEIDFMINVQKGEDGIYYWTINGKWLLNEDGNRVPASAQDGKDGNDGKPMSETGAIAPQMRINPLNRHWEISTDGGNTWSDTGFVADGTNGTDGKDGANDIFSSVTLSDDKKSITFVLRNGDSYTVQII
jgi:hypothetical protein